jgi:hypothetical protein
MSESVLAQTAGITQSSASAKRTKFWIAPALALFVALIFFLSTKPTHKHFDYTYRIAGAFLHGHLGLLPPPPSWLNELVPMQGVYYSVFPLGAVLAVMPLAVLHQAGWINEFPGRVLAAILAGACAYFFFQLTGVENNSLGRRTLLALFPIFGAWTWCNLGFAGAWQIALGFALLGETGAIYFTILRPRPWLAGLFFALAFGNRTELILTLPFFVYFWFFRNHPDLRSFDWKILAKFLAIPAALALATAGYNFARFHSIFDFGYARIPKLIDEPWYQRGLFSLSAIPWNAQKMLLEGMQSIPKFPFFRPLPFGCSIWLSSPFLFLLFREGGAYRRICWLAIGVLTFALWCHGNPGGWQFSYRYGIIVLLPWMFLLLVGNGPRKISAAELSLFIASVAINAVATYQFLWTNEIKP